jgi:hypothetical protein
MSGSMFFTGFGLNSSHPPQSQIVAARTNSKTVATTTNLRACKIAANLLKFSQKDKEQNYCH